MTTTPSPSPGPDPSAPVVAELIGLLSELERLQSRCYSQDGSYVIGRAIGFIRCLQRQPAPSAGSLESDFGKIACTISILKYKASSWSNETNNMVEETLDALTRIWAALRQPAPTALVGPVLRERNLRCWECSRKVLAFDQPGTGFLAPCGHRLADIEECGKEPRCLNDEYGETIYPNITPPATPSSEISDETIRTAVSAYEKWTNRPQPWPATWRYDAIRAALEAVWPTPGLTDELLHKACDIYDDNLTPGYEDKCNLTAMCAALEAALGKRSG